MATRIWDWLALMTSSNRNFNSSWSWGMQHPKVIPHKSARDTPIHLKDSTKLQKSPTICDRLWQNLAYGSFWKNHDYCMHACIVAMTFELAPIQICARLFFWLWHFFCTGARIICIEKLRSECVAMRVATHFRILIVHARTLHVPHHYVIITWPYHWAAS